MAISQCSMVMGQWQIVNCQYYSYRQKTVPFGNPSCNSACSMRHFILKYSLPSRFPPQGASFPFYTQIKMQKTPKKLPPQNQMRHCQLQPTLLIYSFLEHVGIELAPTRKFLGIKAIRALRKGDVNGGAPPIYITHKCQYFISFIVICKIPATGTRGSRWDIDTFKVVPLFEIL